MKKLFSSFVVAATLVSTLGLAAVVSPASAAYSAKEGDKIKVAGNPAVYYVDASSKKHLFANEATFWTWYTGTWATQGVMTITQSEFDAISSSNNVIARAGSLVKFDNSPKVYVAGPNGTLWNITEDAAKSWYGNDYAAKVKTIQVAFEANYTKSSDTLTSTSKVPNGSLVKYQGSTDTYLVWDGKKRLVTSEGFTGNNFRSDMVITIPTSMTFDTGTSVTGRESALSTPATSSGSSSDNGGNTITTPGEEATIDVTVASKPSGNIEIQEGDNKVDVLGIDVEARDGDVLVQRVKLTFATTSSKIWKDVLDTIYLYDGSTLLATVDLNGAVDEGDDAVTDPDTVTISGFSRLVREDQTKTFTVKADAQSGIDSEFETSGYNFTVGMATSGIRAVDGAGIDQYGPTTAFYKTLTVEASAADQASLVLSLNSGNPDKSQVIASSGSDEDERDEVETLRFNLKGEDDDILVTDIAATVSKTGTGAATATVAHLFADGEEVDSASINASTGVVTFNDVDVTISENSTETFMIKVDIENANGTAAVITTSVAATDITAENSDGDDVSASGSATGNQMTFLNAGPEFSLVGTPSIVKYAATDNSTSTVQATFSVKVKAVGDDVTFGTQSASTTFGFGIYQNGTLTTVLAASSTSFTRPSSGVVQGSGQTSFTVQEGNEASVTATFVFEAESPAGAPLSLGSYAVGLESIKWSTDDGVSTTGTSTFMAGDTDWRTSEVTLP